MKSGRVCRGKKKREREEREKGKVGPHKGAFEILFLPL
jgi:hypothetical protein